MVGAEGRRMSPAHDHRQAGHAHGQEAEGARHHHQPPPLPEYIARLEDPERAAWQRPDELVAALGLRGGERVLDFGAGTGYFALRLARAVGARGHVFAADGEAGMLEALRERMTAQRVANVSPLLVPPDDPTLPAGCVDLAFVCAAYHHVGARAAFLGRLVRCLALGGRLVVVDFHKRELPVGPPMEMKISREEAKAELQAAGLTVTEELRMLPYQYVLVARRRGPRRRR